jgi:type I restriction enzyme S subunit
MAFNQGCRGLVPKQELDSRFYRYTFVALADDLSSFGQGSTFTELPSDSLAEFRVPAPSLAHQRAIADYLDAETARIDALIEKKRRTLSLLDERDLRMIDECFAPRTGEALVRLARFAHIQTGLTLHEGRMLNRDAVTRPYLRVANVQPGRLDLSEVKSVTLPKAMATRSTLQPGDVLMTEGGDRDKLGRGTVWRGEIPACLHQNHVFAVRPDPLLLDPEYLAYLTRTSHARAYFEMTGVQSTNLASTSASKVSDFTIPALPIDEQRNRVERYQKFVDKNHRISTALTKQVELLTEHRQALITAAVTGQLEVPGTAVS